MGRVRVDRGSPNKGSLALQQVVVLTEKLHNTQTTLSKVRKELRVQGNKDAKITALENRVDELMNGMRNLDASRFAFNARKFKVTGMTSRKSKNSRFSTEVELTLRTHLERPYDMVMFQEDRYGIVRLVPA